MGRTQCLALCVVLILAVSCLGARVFSGRDWEVLEANSTYDVEAVFIPGLEYLVECSCRCESSVYSHEGPVMAIPTGRFLRFRVWNMCFERNLVIVRGQSVEPGGLVSLVVEFLVGWPRLVALVMGLVSFCMYMRMTPVDIVRDFMYLEPVPGRVR
jgi:hypothetical protein